MSFASSTLPAPTLNSPHIHPLPNKRQLHYATTIYSPPTASSTTTPTSPPSLPTVILFFPGYLSIASAPTLLPAPLLTLSTTTASPIHWLAITLPGNGRSSPTARGSTYQTSLLADIDNLLSSLYPAGPDSVHSIFVSGGSYGSVAAQMVYGHSAPGDTSSGPKWRWGTKVSGLLLLAPFTPFRLHSAYAREMTWMNYISVGPVAKWVPFGLVPWVLSFGVARMVKDVESAERFMRNFILGKMGEEERVMCRSWCEERGITSDEWIREMAEGAVACVKGKEGGFRGFLEGPSVFHSDWGFDPRALGESSRRVLVVVGDEDELGMGMGRWLERSYEGARLKIVKGGHVASLWYQDEIWGEMLEMAKS